MVRNLLIIAQLGGFIPMVVTLSIYAWIAFYKPLRRKYWMAWFVCFLIDIVQYSIRSGIHCAAIWQWHWFQKPMWQWLNWLLTYLWLLELYRVAHFYREDAPHHLVWLIPTIVMLHPLIFWAGGTLPSWLIVAAMGVVIGFPFVRIGYYSRGKWAGLLFGAIGVSYGTAGRVVAALHTWGLWDYYTAWSIETVVSGALMISVAMTFLTLHLSAIADELNGDNELRSQVIQIITQSYNSTCEAVRCHQMELI